MTIEIGWNLDVCRGGSLGGIKWGLKKGVKLGVFLLMKGRKGNIMADSCQQTFFG